MSTETEDRYDVVIYCTETNEIDTMAGENMPLSEGSFHTASKRLATVQGRLNDRYDAAIVPTGIYKKGDTLKPTDIFAKGSECAFVIED